MREKICFDFDWKFFLGNLSPKTDAEGWGAAKGKAFYFGATAIDLDDSGWKSLNIPHDFVLEGDYTRKYDNFSEGAKIPAMETINNRHFAGGSLDGGIGWYRKKFDLPSGNERKRIYLHFDGIFRESTIYLNEFFIGKHTSGYTSFFYDVTDFVNYDKPNLLAVRVDATGREGWWYEGGGIYRHVWLEVVDPVHVVPWGAFVTADPDLESGTAKLGIEIEIMNKQLNDTVVTVESLVLDAKGDTVAKAQSQLDIAKWDDAVCKQLLVLPDAHLWSLDDPYLYRLQTNIYQLGAQVDTLNTSFGVRKIVFDKDRGLLLNGQPVKVKGLCHHHDHAGVGIAVPDRIFQYRLEKVKEMGCNAYRCAHNPPTPELLDMCDRMGILVVDETRQTSSAHEYLDQLRSMVKRDRNHPSVFIWCLGNEEVALQFEPEAERIVRTMRMETKKLDPSRAVTMGICFWSAKEKSRQTHDSVESIFHVTKELDVAGINYSPDKWDTFHEKMPEQPMIITEATSNSGTRGCYETNPHSGGYYIMDPLNNEKEVRKGAAVKRDLGERMWTIYDGKSYMSGYFIWTAFDYRGEPTPMPYPAISSQFGIMDYCGFRKDNFYYYQSWWVDEPVLHIFPHWNWPDKIGEAISVYCYSNMDEVELFVNGHSKGKKSMQKNGYLEWEGVTYQPGILSAVGYKDGVENMRREVKTTGVPHKIELLPDRECISADGQDIAIITVRVLDQDGQLVPTADNQIFFNVRGAGSFLGVGNGNPGSQESDKLPVRRVFGGLCQLLLRAGFVQGELKVEATGIELKKATCVVQVN